MQYYVHIHNPQQTNPFTYMYGLWAWYVFMWITDTWTWQPLLSYELSSTFFLSSLSSFHFISYQQEERESCAQFNSFPQCSSFKRFTHMGYSISIWVLVMFYDFRWKCDNHHWCIFSTSGTTRACIRRLMLVLVMVTMNQVVTLLYASRYRICSGQFRFWFQFLMADIEGGMENVEKRMRNLIEL